VHGCPGEHASETPSVEIMHREAGDKVFGERLAANARYCSSSSSPACYFIEKSGDSNNAMGNKNNEHGDAAAGATFLVAVYVISLFTLHYYLFHIQIC
jgi:hypothetical protein